MARKKKRKPISTTRGSVTQVPTKEGAPEKWQIRVYHGVDPRTHKRVYRSKTITGTKADALRLNEIMVARTRTRRASEGGSTITVGEIGDRWLAEKELQVSLGKIKQVTWDRYEYMFRKHVNDRWGDYVAVNLTGTDISDGLNDFLEMHTRGERGFGIHLIESIRSVLYQIIYFAVSKEIIDKNPCDGVDFRITQTSGNQSADQLSMDKDHLVAPDRESKVYVLTREQQAQFLAVAKETTEYALWMLMLHTGMRIGEACALSWDDIYEDHITIRGTIAQVRVEIGKGKRVVTAPKTATSIRSVEISKNMHRALIEHRKQEMKRQLEVRDWQYPQYIFHSDSGLVMSPKAAMKKVRRIYKKIGLPEFGSRTHVMRHTHATFSLWDNPGSLMALSKRLGHANPHITMRVYAHAMPESQDAIMKASDKLLFGT